MPELPAGFTMPKDVYIFALKDCGYITPWVAFSREEAESAAIKNPELIPVRVPLASDKPAISLLTPGEDYPVDPKEVAYKTALIEQEISAALVLSDRPLVNGAAAQLIKLWRDEFTVNDEGRLWLVRSRDGRSPKQWADDHLSGDKDYAHFLAGPSPIAKSNYSMRTAPVIDFVDTPNGCVRATEPLNWKDSILQYEQSPAARPNRDQLAVERMIDEGCPEPPEPVHHRLGYLRHEPLDPCRDVTSQEIEAVAEANGTYVGSLLAITYMVKKRVAEAMARLESPIDHHIGHETTFSFVPGYHPYDEQGQPVIVHAAGMATASGEPDIAAIDHESA